MGLTECAHDPFSDEVKGVIVMSEGGLKMYSKYYSADLAGASPQRLAELEKAIFEKTKGLTSARLENEVLVVKGHLVLFRFENDVFFYVLGWESHNPMMASFVLTGIHEATCDVLSDQVEYRTVMENLEYLILIIDESVDDGRVFESDPTTLVQRVILDERAPEGQSSSESSGSGRGASASGDITLSDALEAGFRSLKNSFLSMR